MNAQEAKAAADVIAEMWEGESRATCEVIGAVKDDNRDYRPDPKSRSAWELATHIATADMWFIDCITKGTFVFDQEKAKQAEAQFRTVADIVAFYEKVLPPSLTRLRDLPAEQLSENVDFFGMMKMSRAQWIGFANNHSVHHRGQLSAYLRNMDCRVPDIYGPSGDAEKAPEAVT